MASRKGPNTSLRRIFRHCDVIVRLIPQDAARLVFGPFRLAISSISLMTFPSLAGFAVRSFDFKL